MNKPSKEFLEGFNQGHSIGERHSDCASSIYESLRETLIKHNQDLLSHLEQCPQTTQDELEFSKRVLSGSL